MDADRRDELIEKLEAENEELRRQIKKLHDRIEELERQANRQAAPFSRKEKERKPRDQHRKPGQGDPGQPRGHLPPTFSGFRRRIEMAKE